MLQAFENVCITHSQLKIKPNSIISVQCVHNSLKMKAQIIIEHTIYLKRGNKLLYRVHDLLEGMN